MGSTVTSMRHREHQWQHNGGVASAESGEGLEQLRPKRNHSPSDLSCSQAFTKITYQEAYPVPQTTHHPRKQKGAAVSGFRGAHQIIPCS